MTISVLRSSIEDKAPDRELIQKQTEAFLSQGNSIEVVSPEMNAWNRISERTNHNKSRAKQAATTDARYMELYGDMIKNMLLEKTPMKTILEVTGIPYKSYIRILPQLTD